MMRRLSLLLTALFLIPAVFAAETPLGHVRTSGEAYTYNYSPVVAANGSEWLTAWNREAARVDEQGNVIDRPALKLSRQPMRALGLGSSYLLASEGDNHEVVITRYEPSTGRETVVATIPTMAERIFSIDLDSDGSSVLVTWIEYSRATSLGIALFDSNWNLIQRSTISGVQAAAACAATGGTYLVVSGESDGIKSRIVTAAGTLHQAITVSTRPAYAVDVARLGVGYLVIAATDAFVLDPTGVPAGQETIGAFGSDAIRIACGGGECLAVSNISPRGDYTGVTAARFSSADGRLLDSGILIRTSKFNSKYTNGGDGIDVAWNGSRFLVVTSDGYLSFSALATNIYGRFVSAGDPIAPDTPLFLMSYRAVPQLNLGAAVNGSVERFVWSEPTVCGSVKNPIFCSGWAVHTQAMDESGKLSDDVLFSMNSSDNIDASRSAIARDGDGFLVAFIEFESGPLSGTLKSARIAADGTVSDIQQIATAAVSIDADASLLGPVLVWSSSDGIVHLLVHGNQLTLGTGVFWAPVSIASDGTGALVAWQEADAVNVLRVDLSSLKTTKPISIAATDAGPFAAFNGISYVVGCESRNPDDTRTIRAYRFRIDGLLIDASGIEIARGNVVLTDVGALQEQCVFVFDERAVPSCPSVTAVRLFPNGQLAGTLTDASPSVIAVCATTGIVANDSAARAAYRRLPDSRAYVNELTTPRRHAARTDERRRPIRRTSP